MNELVLEEIVVEDTLEEIAKPTLDSTQSDYEVKLDSLRSQIQHYVERYNTYVTGSNKAFNKVYKANKKEVKKIKKKIKKIRKENKELREFFKKTNNTEKIKALNTPITECKEQLSKTNRLPMIAKRNYLIDKLKQDLPGSTLVEKLPEHHSITDILHLYKDKALSEIGEMSPAERGIFSEAYDYFVSAHTRRNQYLHQRAFNREPKLGGAILGGGAGIIVAATMAPLSPLIATGLGIAAGIGYIFGLYEVEQRFTKRDRKKADKLFTREWEMYKADYLQDFEKVREW